MLQIRKRVKAMFARPERKLTEIMPELRELRQALRSAYRADDALFILVKFFNIISMWHDRGIKDIIDAFKEVDYGQYGEIIESLETLQKHFVRAGRDKFGYNRTEPNQTVTDENVFLGDRCGLSTKPISFWKKHKGDKKGGWGYPGMEHLNAYDVVSDQARNFLNSHVAPMIEIINKLEVAAGN